MAIRARSAAYGPAAYSTPTPQMRPFLPIAGLMTMNLAPIRRRNLFQRLPVEVDQSPELLTRRHLLTDLDLRAEESCLA
jgi:hypothetical protein